MGINNDDESDFSACEEIMKDWKLVVSDVRLKLRSERERER